MNAILLYFLIGPSLGDSIQALPTDSADLTEYYNDSLRLHDVYAYQISYLTTLKETDTAKWNSKAIHDHLVTCGTRTALSNYNRVRYEPIDSFKRPGCETAYKYPKPLGNKLHHVSYDEQIRFIKKDNGLTRRSYITKTVYSLDDGSVLFEEKLDPITLKKIIE